MGAFVYALHLGGFPNLSGLHASSWQVLPASVALAGIIETVRCIHRQWNLYQAGILILLYSEVMILGMAVFLFFYP